MSSAFFLSDYLSSLAASFLPKRKLLAKWRDRWGQPGDREGLLASRYADLTREDSAAVQVDDGTWIDLEFPDIFARMNTTVTPLGSQVLYRQLRTREDDPAVLTSRYASYAHLRADRDLREKLQLSLTALDREGSAHVCAYLFGTLPEPGTYEWLLKCWAVIAIAILVLAMPLGLPAWLWVPVLAINLGISMANMANVSWKMKVLQRCMGLLGVSDRLAGLSGSCPALPQLAALAREKKSRQQCARVLRGVRLIVGIEAAKTPLLPEVANAVKALLLIEVLVVNRAIKRFAAVRDKLKKSFELVGEIDAAIAVASWLESAGVQCQPQLVDDGRLAIVDGRHPLIADGVGNAIDAEGKSVLVTGSNMAGKTTFIKMVGINLILGRTLGVCLAASAVVPRGRVMASIHSRHSVGSGKSHYFAEIDTIKSYLALADEPGFNVFLIDEPFSGTNTIERIAIARAVLEVLSRGACVLVTTHDVELQGFLDAANDLYHFQEDPDVDGFFDYQLKPGASRNRNAIGLLERIGFPADIVAASISYASDAVKVGNVVAATQAELD